MNAVNVGQQAVDARDTHVGQPVGIDAVGPEDRRALVGYRGIGRTGRDHQHPVPTIDSPSPHHGVAQHGSRGVDA